MWYKTFDKAGFPGSTLISTCKSGGTTVAIIGRQGGGGVGSLSPSATIMRIPQSRIAPKIIVGRMRNITTIPEIRA